MKNKTILILLLATACVHCGKKGPLVLEADNPPPAVKNFQVRQIGSQVDLSWEFPGLPASAKETFENALVSKVHIYHAVLKPGEAPPEADFIAKAELLARPKAAEIKGLARNFPQYRVAFKNKDLQGKIHGFALVYFYGRGKSQPSPLRTLNALRTPPPIQDLQVSRQGKMVILNWSKPAAEDKERAMRPIIGYQVYRKISAADGDFDFRAIGTGKTVNEFFHDLDTGADGDYEYQVSCRLDARVESAPSNIVAIKVEDTFPPDIPGNLVIFTAKDQIFLTWENVPDTDLAFYRLYRKNSDKEDFKLLADEISENFFRDKKISSGKLYIYALTAVDKKGNESELSLSAQQLFE